MLGKKPWILVISILFGLLFAGISFTPTSRVQKAFAASNPAPTLKLPWIGPAYGISGYSYGCGDHLNYGGKYRDAYALDFGLPDHTPLAAVANGIIHYGYDGATTSYGHYIYIVHTDSNWNPIGYVSVYAHMGHPDDQTTGYLPSLPDGSHVIQGQWIGYSGYSGNVDPKDTRGAHLHFSLRMNATSIDDGDPAVPEPMSGYHGFKHYGRTSDIGTAPNSCGWVDSPSFSPSNSMTRQTLLEVEMNVHNAIGKDWNNNPVHNKRSITVKLTDYRNQTIGLSSTVTYYQATGTFLGYIDLGTSWSSASYLVKLKLSNTLSKTVDGIYTITNGGASILASITLRPGDINGDDTLDIQDYNILVSCFGSKQCPSDQKVASDLNDDNAVDGTDYNIFLKEIGHCCS